MGDVARIDFGRLLAAVEARDEAEAGERGISVDELHAQRERDAQASRDAQEAERVRLHALARAESVVQHVPLTDADQARVLAGRYEETAPLIAVREWLQNPNDTPILVLAGYVGRGKTVAAAWALCQRPGYYFRARSFERLFAHRYGDEHLDKQARVLGAGLVVVDDLGGREDTVEACASYLLDLVDERRTSRTRTLLITNQPQPLFYGLYKDDRLKSRLGQSARWAAAIKGQDLRGAP
jgi:DNA replication protein DnaC